MKNPQAGENDKAIWMNRAARAADGGKWPGSPVNTPGAAPHPFALFGRFRRDFADTGRKRIVSAAHAENGHLTPQKPRYKPI
jgi:hypothetical protein